VEMSNASGRTTVMHVFILWHVHEMESGENDSKLIGVYSSEELAMAARERARRLPGFRERPDAFVIDRYNLDTDHWPEGYVTVH
jgi:hypothetical protein